MQDLYLNDFSAKLQTLQKDLSKKQKEFLCLKSIENFVLYYNQLSHSRLKVENLLNEYFKSIDEVLEFTDNQVNFQTCKFLVKNYILPIGKYYEEELDFHIQPSL